MKKSTDTFDHTRLRRWVERVFTRSGNTKWPTVRDAAKALRWTQTRVTDAIEGNPDGEGNMFTSTYFVDSEPRIGDHFIELTATHS